jgi:hypothetical protein
MTTGSNKWAFMLLIAVIAYLVGCNDGPAVKTPDFTVADVQPDTSNRKSLAEFEGRIAQRFLRNDTAVIDHHKLQDLIADSITGYLLEVNEASTFHAPLFTFAEASKVFYNAHQDYIELTAGDYVCNPDFFRVNIQRYNLAMGVEISGVKDEKRLNVDFEPSAAEDFFVWASYNSRKHLAWVFIGIDERYFVTVEATAQDGFIDMKRLQDWLRWESLFPTTN